MTGHNSVCEHESDQQRFVIHTKAGEAVLEYQRTGHAVDFVRTFVPDSLRGQGLAEQLVRAGLAWAKAEQLTMTASCWYVDQWLQRGV